MPRLAREFLNSGGGSSNYSSDIVGRGLSGTEALHVTAVAEQMSVKGETAATFLVTQLHAAVLTVVALKVIITVHGYHPHNVLTALKHGESHEDKHSMVSPNPHPIPQKPCSTEQIPQKPLCT